MATKTYNGFPTAYRSEQGRKTYGAFSTGELERPTQCVMCGHRKGVGAENINSLMRMPTLQAHQEDYHRPMAMDSVVGVCFFCHMAIHRRFQNITTWRKWATLVSMGWRPPTGRDYRDFAITWSIIGRKEVELVQASKNFAHILPEVEPDYYTGRKLGDPLIFDSLEGYEYAATTI